MPIILVPGVGRVLKSGGGLKLGNCAACECKCDACLNRCKDTTILTGPCATACNPTHVRMTVSGLTICTSKCVSTGLYQMTDPCTPGKTGFGTNETEHRITGGTLAGSFCLTHQATASGEYAANLNLDDYFTLDNCLGTPRRAAPCIPASLVLSFFGPTGGISVNIMSLGIHRIFIASVANICNKTCAWTFTNQMTSCSFDGNNVAYGGTVTIEPCCL